MNGNDGEYIILNRREEEEEESLPEQGRPVRNPAVQRRRAAETQSAYQYFDCGAVRESMRLTRAVSKRGQMLCQEKKIRVGNVETGFGEDLREIRCRAIGEGQEGRRTFPMEIIFSREKILYGECECQECLRHYYRYYRKEYCSYLAGFLNCVENFIEGKNIGDATDGNALRLIHNFAQQRANSVTAEVLGRKDSLDVCPRVVQRDTELRLSFKVGGEKLFVIKDLKEFCDNINSSKTATYGSKTQINHDIGNFTEEGKKWIRFIGGIVKEERTFEWRMRRTYDFERRSGAKLPETVLEGWKLDEFYALLEEGEAEFEETVKGKKQKSALRAGEQNPKVSIHIKKNKISDRRTFHGIEVECRMPSIYQGARAAYFIQDGRLLRIQEDCFEKIRMLAEARRRNDALRFEVGRNNLSQFYYNVLPQLEGVADVTEENGQEIASYLPPRAEFVFYLDAENNNMSCRAAARYEEEEFSLLDVEEEGRKLESFREELREREVLLMVRQWFPFLDEKGELHCGQDEERMYSVLEEGVEALLKLGEVQCTRRFANVNIDRRMKVSVGISVSQNLLNLEISTQDVPPEELLDILKSYRQKKRYHRLKNGDFLRLEDQTYETLSEMMSSLRVNSKDLLKGNIKLPMYRALYLDGLLEKNEEIYSSRDSHFRQIVKSFKTVKDADFEAPVSLNQTLRGYQTTGYRWLRMLETYHLGGILADDMGLGKTLQVLTVLLAAKQEGKTQTSLVVSPASLIYNWGEEIRRFAPELTFEIISGNQDERIKKLEEYQNYDVIVTSYDLLKRDAVHYEDKEFGYQIIDEAQYIKNHNTAAAKAVKVIKSATRYALTGTPIENRLSELWSIFDYLMPGYLYGYDVFRNDFEAPIVRDGDEKAVERLRRMTAPFILRRMKENVLKDLPEKLEESRYVRLEPQQQRLYDGQLLHMKQRIAAQDSQEFQKNKIQILAELMKLRQICCAPQLCFENYEGESAKLEACVELVRSAMEGNHKVLLFSQFTSMLNLLAGRLEQEKISFYTITGATSKEKRMELVKAFNGDDTNVFLISLKAGGVGLNLTGADVVIHYDPWWNLAVQNQATDRAHRIGQTKKVVVYRLIAKGTIEEKIQELQESKKALSEQVISGDTGQLAAMTKEEFISLLS